MLFCLEGGWPSELYKLNRAKIVYKEKKQTVDIRTCTYSGDTAIDLRVLYENEQLRKRITSIFLFSSNIFDFT